MGKQQRKNEEPEKDHTEGQGHLFKLSLKKIHHEGKCPKGDAYLVDKNRYQSGGGSGHEGEGRGRGSIQGSNYLRRASPESAKDNTSNDDADAEADK